MKKFSLVVLSLTTMLRCATWAQSSPAVIQVSCHVNGTLYDGSDDVLTVLVQPQAPSVFYEAPYTYTITATQGGSPISVFKSNLTTATDIGYGYAVPINIPGGKAGNGNIVLTITPYGSYAPQTVIVSDPGSCAENANDCVSGPHTTSYSYRSPFLVTELDENIIIPQFNPGANQTLQSVTLQAAQNVIFSTIAENNSINDAHLDVTSTLMGSVQLNASTIGDISAEETSGNQTLTAGIQVDAQNSWPGDASGADGQKSTLTAMNSWLRPAVLSGLDPRNDPRYVTKASAVAPAENSTYDDDMFFNLFSETSASANYTYTPTDVQFASFVGSGDIPGSFMTESSFRSSASGGNLQVSQFTQAYFTVNVEYSYLQTCITTLPVTIKSFNAKHEEGQLAFEWNVAQENGVSHYDVEVSANAKNFKKLTSVKASGQDHYQTTSNILPSGTIYFRLKSVDLDGTYAYSHMVSLDINRQESLSLYPLPAHDVFYVKTDTPADVANIVIRNLASIPVKTIPYSGEPDAEINVDNLSPGLYLVQLNMTDGRVITKKLVVTR